MSEVINTTILRDKNGVMVSMIDQTARDGVAANATEIGKLSEEIDGLKTPGEGVTSTQSGSVVVFDRCVAGTKIAVDGDVSETVTLIQNSKNFAPYMPSHQDGTELAYTPLDDGKFVLTGKATGTHWVYFWHPTVGSVRNKLLPAGVYTIHTDLDCTVNGATAGGFVLRSWDGESITTGGAYLANEVDKNRPKQFTLTKPTWCSLVLTWHNSSEAYNGTFYVQIERGSETTDFVKHVRNEYATAYPITINAISGENILFDSAGTTITATYAEGNAVGGVTVATINSLIDAKLAYDPVLSGMTVLYLEGDTSAMTKDDAVELAYVYGERSGTCTVKWQGSSSLSFPKKNYTVKFDNAFEAAEGWGEQKKYCTKANWIDFSHSRNNVNAKLWGQIVASRSAANATLEACPNYGAVDGYPIAIVINGKYMGVYTFNIPKDAWMMNMGSGTNECILCADYHVAATQFKAAAALAGGDFEVEYITDENNIEWARTSLNNLINACATSNGSNLDTTIATMLDWDSAIDYYIFISLIRGNDMVDKNYILATHDGTKWFFSAYDMDCTYGLAFDGAKFFSATKDALDGQTWNMTQIAARHRLFELIKTYKLDALKARYAELRASVMSEDNVAFMFRNFAGGIPKLALDADNRTWPTIPNTNVNNVQQIIDWYRIRCAYIDKEIEAM